MGGTVGRRKFGGGGQERVWTGVFKGKLWKDATRFSMTVICPFAGFEKEYGNLSGVPAI
jgi:hypothetical protein